MVISSPSGGGKTTICRGLMRRNKDYIFSISVTTRKRRENERDGKDYYFLSEKEFKEKVRRGKLAEWARVHNHHYGTLKRFVDLAQKKGKTVLFDVDVQGGTTLKTKYADAILIFLLPPSMEELRERLKHREKANLKEVKTRIGVALKEMKFVSKYDYVVVNKEIDESIEAVEQIINSERRRTWRLNLKELFEKM